MADKPIDLVPPPEISNDMHYIWKNWFLALYRRVGSGPFLVRGYTVATLPSAAKWSDATSYSALVYVSNEAGGATLAFSDGTNWRRVTDRAIVS